MSDYTFCFHGNDLLVPDSLPDTEVVNGTDANLLEHCIDDYTFDRGSSRVRILVEAAEAPLPPGFRTITARTAMTEAAAKASDGQPLLGEKNDHFQARLVPFLSAVHINQWRKDSLFCGGCGAKNGDAPDELARLCPRCGRREYPRISPAVIVLVEDSQGRALLAHNVKFRAGMHGLLAGFVEAGETLESTVAREIREEVGVEICDITYIGSQSWPFPNSLMLAFRARYAGGILRPDGIEIECADWFDRGHLPSIPTLGTVARTIIDGWLSERPADQVREL